MIALDTNHLVRFFTNDIKKLALAAKRTIEKQKEIFVPTIAIAETVYVLTNDYNKTKSIICTQIESLLGLPNIRTQDFVMNALKVYEVENISIYDCLILAECIRKNILLKTFDKRLEKVYKKYSQN